MEENNQLEKNIDSGEYVNEAHVGKIPPITKAQTNIIMSQLDRHICKIYVTKNDIGTGFFCRIRYPDENRRLPVLFTNNHVLNDKQLEIDNKIKITLDDDKIEKNILIDKSRLTFTDPVLDVTIIEIKPEDQINSFLEVDENVFDNDYTEIYKKDTPIYLLQYPEGVAASHAIGRIDKILKTRIFHSCSTEPGSSGSPILLLSTFKVIGVHKGTKKEKAEITNLGTWIKFPIEEFNKKYPNIVNDNINPIKPIIFQEEDINKKIPENPEKINNKQEINNVNIIDDYFNKNDNKPNDNNKNNNNEENKKMNYLEKFKDDYEQGQNVEYDYLFENNYNNKNENSFNYNHPNYQNNNYNNNNYRENNHFNSGPDNNHNQYYNIANYNNLRNNNNRPNINPKRENNYNNQKPNFQKSNFNNNNSKTKVSVFMCAGCLNQKICCLCKIKNSPKLSKISGFKAHSTCSGEHECFQCRGNAHGTFLNVCETCKSYANQLKSKGSLCFICKRHL